jgi:hypothetical protein
MVTQVTTEDLTAYDLVGSDGGVFTCGDATGGGSFPGLNVRVANVAGAVPTG